METNNPSLHQTQGDSDWGATALVTTQTEYLGTTTITKPQVGSWQATTVDGRGRTSNVKTYNGTTAPTAAGLANPGAITTYSYGYNENTNNTGNTITQSGWLTTTMTDDAGNQTIMLTDLLGRTVTSTDPNAGNSAFFYDSNANITQTRDAVVFGTGEAITSWGNTINTSYDALNRPTYRWSGTATSWGTAATADRLASWAYDWSGVTNGKGMLSQETSWQDSLPYTSGVYSYTNRYQVSAHYTVIPTGSPLPTSMEGTWNRAYSFNEAGQKLIDWINTVPNGSTEATITHYDGYGNADQMTGGGGTTDSYVTSTAFDDLGRITQRTLARNTTYTSEAALVRHYGYDTETGLLDTIQAGWDTTPSDLTGNTWFQYDRYTRDPVGNVTVIEDRGLEPGGAGSNIKECFVYDEWNRLVRAHTAPGTTDGNETVGCATSTGTNITARGATSPYDRTWSFDDINRITGSADKANGNATTTWGYSSTKHAVLSLTGQTSGSYSYNTVGAMVSRNGDTLTYDPQQRLTGYDTSSVDDTYLYTTSNQRLIRQHGSTVTLYLGDMEIGYDGTNTTVTRYISIAGTQVSTVTKINGGTASIAWNCGNMQNSAICQAPTATNASPPIPGRKRYTPYGDDRNTTPYTNTDHGFLGQPEDTTGLTYLNNRYYDPQTGEFLSVDPLVASTGDPYIYADGNPTTLSDPAGLCAIQLGLYMGDDGTGPCETGTGVSSDADGNLVVRDLHFGSGDNGDWSCKVRRCSEGGGRSPADQMQISAAGIAMLKSWEGYDNTPYDNDGGGNCTVGYGHLLHSGPCTSDESARLYTDDEIEALLKDDLANATGLIPKVTAGYDLTQNEYDALAIFLFQQGRCGLCVLDQNKNNPNADLRYELDKGPAGWDPDTLRELWVGRFVDTNLERRRRAEVELFLTGVYYNND